LHHCLHDLAVAQAQGARRYRFDQSGLSSALREYGVDA